MATYEEIYDQILTARIPTIDIGGSTYLNVRFLNKGTLQTGQRFFTFEHMLMNGSYETETVYLTLNP